MPGLTLATTSAVRDDIIRVGLNYKLFAPAAGSAGAIALPVTAPGQRSVWSGGYVGLNGGYGVASNTFSQVVTVAGLPAASTFANANVAPSGGIFGGQGGYNWQNGAVVVGVEGDVDWADQRGSSCGIACTTALNPILFATVEQKLDWLATVRGRVGWANDGYLFYLTGGGAFGGVTETDALPGVPGSSSFSRDRAGWTAGGGIEAKVWGNWTGKLEYLYVDLGNTADSFTFGAGPTVLTTTSANRDNIVRAGFNYKLGG